MKYSLIVDASMREQIRHYPPELKHKVRESLEQIMRFPRAGKALTSNLTGYFSYRVGRFRIIYQISGDRIFLITIGPRKTIYQKIIAETKRTN